MKNSFPSLTPFWIGLFLTLMLGSTSGFAQTDTNQDVLQDTVLAREYLDKAKAFNDSAKYDQALEILDSSALLISNSVGDESLLFAEYLNLVGDVFYQKAEYNKAQDYYEQSLNIFKALNGEDHPDVAKGYFDLGDILMSKGDYDKAKAYYEKSLKTFKLLYGDYHSYVAFSYHKLGDVFVRKGDYDEAQENLEQSLNIRKSVFGEDHIHVAYSYIGLADVLDEKGDYDKAQEYLEKSLKIIKSVLGENHVKIAFSYNNLGNVLDEKGNYNKAQAYYEQSLKIRKIALGENHPYIANSYNNLGNVLDEKGNYNEAQKYLEQSLRILKSVYGENHPEVAIAYMNLGVILESKGDYDKAQGYYEQSLKIRKIALGGNHPYISGSYNNLGSLFNKKGNYAEAQLYLEQALKIRKSLLGENHPEFASTLYNLGALYYSKGDYAITSRYFDQALDALNFQNDSSLLKVKKIPLLLTIFQNYGELYNALYNKTNDIENLIKAKEVYEQYERATAHQKSNVLEGIQTKLSTEALPTYEFAIQTNLLLFNASDKSVHLSDAFSYSEKTKALSLFEAIQNADALKYGGIPDSLLDKEYDLGVDIAYYNKKWFEKINSGLAETDTTALEIKSKLFDLREEQEALRKQFETDYQKYYELKYDLEIASVVGIQDYLQDEKTALVEYFLGDTTLTTFGVTKAGIVYDQQSIDSSFYQQLETIRKTLNQSSAEAPIPFQNYTQYSYDLYQTLLEPILAQMSSIENLIIIPDGQLGYLPFETLLTQNVSAAAENYRGLPYLLREYDVRYEYSATLLLQAADKKSGSSKRFAGYAPAYGDSDFMAQRGYYDSLKIVRSFPGLRDGPAPLAYNQPEVNDISGTIDGDAFTGALATESAFKRDAGDYQILHLAMHALVNDTDPMYSHLIFAEDADSTEDRYLHAYELYNMQLDADLAVLSACETGLGKLQRGEGIMSLSRAFKYAGCPSIVTSLWKANDLSTKEIMTAFYQNLKDGMSKSEALRKAKLDFLDNTETPGMTHPSNWATFVLIGNNEPVQMGNGWIRYLAIGIPVILVLVFGARRIRRRTSTAA